MDWKQKSHPTWVEKGTRLFQLTLMNQQKTRGFQAMKGAPFFLTLGDFFMAFFVAFFGIFFRAGAAESISLVAGFDTSRKGFRGGDFGEKKIQWFVGKT